MGVIYDYFAAASDERAAETIGLVGGPGEAGFRTLMVKGIDPVVQLRTLESLLTGVDYDVVAQNPRAGHTLAIRDEGEGAVCTITEELRDAMTRATPQQLKAVAGPWSQTEEFGGRGDPRTLAEFLHDLSGLARLAHQGKEQLYCWICV